MVGSATHARHAQQLRSAYLALSEGETELAGPDPRLEIAADHLRRAIRSLDELVGRIGVEDVLGEIFSSFCIGK